MTLKELRISKGLSQIECARLFNMTTRNYQNYENDPKKINTFRYNAIFNVLSDYGSINNNGKFILRENIFNTNVILDNGLSIITSSIKNYKKRDCFSMLEKYINEDNSDKVCILYGLRRTGKTTLLFQMIDKLPLDKTIYIKIKVTDNMKMLVEDLYNLYHQGYKYIFIDEITLMDDFINTASVLSDIFVKLGMKIILSGTDSLGFLSAMRDELYDRARLIHTSFISFKEYYRLLNIKSIDQYIEYGGTLKMENMNFNDPDYRNDDVSFKDNESTRKYIDSSISRNIQRTLKNDSYGSYFNELRDLYNQGELTNIINRVVESVNHEFVLSIITQKFKSHDLGSSKDLLMKEFPLKVSTVLYDIDGEEVVNRLKKIIDIKDKEETKIAISQEHIDKVKAYLEKLDLLFEYKERYESKSERKIYTITQPGMRYSITKALIYSLIQDDYFKTISEYDKQYIVNKILEDIKGRMLEEMVLLEKTKLSLKDEEVFKFKFDNGGEVDMIVYNKSNNTCKLYEIKHTIERHEKQIRHLLNEEKCKIIENRFGKIIGKYVLYRGKNTSFKGVKYLNVEEFLCK